MINHSRGSVLAILVVFACPSFVCTKMIARLFVCLLVLLTIQISANSAAAQEAEQSYRDDVQKLIEAALLEFKKAPNSEPNSYFLARSYLAAGQLDNALASIELDVLNHYQNLQDFVVDKARQGKTSEATKTLLAEPYVSSRLLAHSKSVEGLDGAKIETLLNVWTAQGQAIQLATDGEIDQASALVKKLAGEKKHRRRRYDRVVIYKLVLEGKLDEAASFSRKSGRTGIENFDWAVQQAFSRRGPERGQQLIEKISQMKSRRNIKLERQTKYDISPIDPKTSARNSGVRVEKLHGELKELNFSGSEKIVKLYKETIQQRPRKYEDKSWLGASVHAWLLAEIAVNADSKTAIEVSGQLLDNHQMEFSRWLVVGELVDRGKVDEATEFAKHVRQIKVDRASWISRQHFRNLQANEKKFDKFFEQFNQSDPEQNEAKQRMPIATGFQILHDRYIESENKKAAMETYQQIAKLSGPIPELDLRHLVQLGWHHDAVAAAMKAYGEHKDEYEYQLGHTVRIVAEELSKDHQTDEIFKIVKNLKSPVNRAKALMAAAAKYAD